jgi:hypothetical protein
VSYTPLPKELAGPNDEYHAAAAGERLWDRPDETKSKPAIKLPE